MTLTTSMPGEPRKRGSTDAVGAYSGRLENALRAGLGLVRRVRSTGGADRDDPIAEAVAPPARHAKPKPPGPRRRVIPYGARQSRRRAAWA